MHGCVRGSAKATKSLLPVHVLVLHKAACRIKKNYFASHIFCAKLLERELYTIYPHTGTSTAYVKVDIKAFRWHRVLVVTVKYCTDMCEH